MTAVNERDEYAVVVDHATVRFNIASEKIDNLKEYFVKMVKHQLMFQEFLALNDVSFKVKKGDSWGIIGTNGSGKSTMLKMICRILKPYKGSVHTYGTIAPLIELSAGFCEDLTARENIFLNGAVLGYDEKFMEEHFDEIVDFAELHNFLDMPIKNYSSGMAARLGFSIATMVNPDILICDEVLAVGDLKFQKKCEKRMAEMRASGTTLLFVSHSMESVRSVCKNALWLSHGKVMAAGPVDEVSDQYLRFLDEEHQ
ncbi:MAG: ABC transporter ATP-binding protein [Solobacterium sp.]|nr:ABC transporter ATP-binding protein [Solobacterium sp.]